MKMGMDIVAKRKCPCPLKFVQTRAEDKLVWTMPSAAEFGETQKNTK